MSLLSTLTGWVGRSAKRAVEREHPFVIAITGAVGKSSTKQVVAALLHAQDPAAAVRAPRKNYNNQLGLPLVIFNKPLPGRSPFAWLDLLWTAFVVGFGFRTTGVKTFVLEMGADHPGDLAYLTSIAKPNLSIVTAVTPENPDWAPVHAANYPSVDAVAREKATIVRALDASGSVVLNADDARVIAMRHETAAKLTTFGTTEAADVVLTGSRIRTEETRTGFLPVGREITVSVEGRAYSMYLPGVFGRSTAQAVIAGLAAGKALGLAMEDMVRSLSAFEPPPGRVRLIPGIKGTMLLDDSYNASPVAALAALRDLASIDIDETRQRRIACLGEMRELGEQSAMLHEQVGLEAAKLGLDLLAVSGAQSEAYVRGAKLGGMRDEQIHVFDDVPELGIWVQDILKPGDLVLAKASEGPMKTAEGYLKTKGVRMERVIKELMAEPARAGELLARQEAAWTR